MIGTSALRAILLATSMLAPLRASAQPCGSPGVRRVIAAAVAAGEGRRAIDHLLATGEIGRQRQAAPAGIDYAANGAGPLATDASASAPDPVIRQYALYQPESAPAATPLPHSPAVQSDYVPYGAPTTAAPVKLAQAPATLQPAQNDQPLDAAALGNPFRPGSTPLPTLDEPTAPSGGDVPRGAHSVSSDPLTAQIDDGIAQLQGETAPRVEGSLSLRGRSGAAGLEQLFEVAAPLEASFSPDGYGRLKVAVTPTWLYSGQGKGANDFGRFGTNPLGLAGTRLRRQSATGAALDVGYAYDIASVDIGATPLGFREQNVVGGIELAPKLDDDLTLRAVIERRAVSDSILSYAGMKDGRSGTTWGGVTRNRGHLQLEGLVEQASYYVGGGGGLLIGDKVASNTQFDAGAGVSYPVWQSISQEVRVGADLVYFGYEKNLSGFSLGQGGYFSPQQFLALLFPVSYREQVSPDLTYTVGGSIGVDTFRTKSSAIFPKDSARQASLVALAAATPGLATTIGGIHSTGFAGGVRAEVDYRVTDDLHIGARVGFDRSGNFNEGTGLVYARYLFNDSF